MGVADETREPRAGEEIGIKRDDYVGGGKVVNRIIVATEGSLRSLAHGIAVYWLVAVPFGLRKLLQEGLHLRAEGRRTDRTTQETQLCALLPFLLEHGAPDFANKLGPRRAFTHFQ